MHALYVFACFTDHMKHRFKPLDVYEAIWIKKASHGGLQYAEPGGLAFGEFIDLSNQKFNVQLSSGVDSNDL